MKQYDANSIAERVIDRIKTKIGQKEILFVGANRRFVDALSEEFADVAQEQEYLTREAKWSLAREFSSILAQTEFFPYVPHRKIGAKGDLLVSTNEDFAGDYFVDITIPRFFRFSNGDLIFASREAVVLSAGQDFATVPIVQGTPRKRTFEIASGEYPEERYITLTINNPNIENEVYRVRVNGIEWDEIDNLRLSEDGEDQVFRVRNLRDFSGVQFQFGNDVFGKKLEYGDVVEIDFVETEGPDGNVLATDNITEIVSEATDEEGEEVELFCTNEEEVTGGSTYESIASIRANAPQSYKSANRAITKEDYQVLILGTGLVDRVTIWGEEEVNEDLGNPPGTFLPTEENLVYISAYSIDTQTDRGISVKDPNRPDTIGSTEQSIRETLNEVKPPTDILRFEPTDFIYVNFRTTAFIQDRRFSGEEVRGRIRSTLSSKYNLEEVNHNQDLYFSEYFQVIQDVEGVRWHRTDIDFTKFFRFRRAYEFNMDLALDGIKPGTVKLYVRQGDDEDDWMLVATDRDEDGNLIGEPVDPDEPEGDTYDLPNAVINYDTGDADEVIISFGLDDDHTTYELRCDFKLDEAAEGSLLLSRRNQIFAYRDAEVTPEIMT